MSEDDASPAAGRSDRRIARTQASIRNAYIKLFFERGFDDISVGDILEAADIARSTFYQHFTSKEQLLCATMQPMLTDLAEAVDSIKLPAGLNRVTTHFWSNRRLAHAVFTGTARVAIVRMLADLIEPRLDMPANGAAKAPAPRRLIAMHIASMQLGLLEEWLSGRYGCTPESLARALHLSTRATARALTSGGE